MFQVSVILGFLPYVTYQKQSFVNAGKCQNDFLHNVDIFIL